MLWLQDNQQRVDVVLIQETHWKIEGSRSFNSGPYQVLTAGAKDKNAGLATLIHRRVCAAEAEEVRSHTILHHAP